MNRVSNSGSPGRLPAVLAVVVAAALLTPWTFADDEEKPKEEKPAAASQEEGKSENKVESKIESSAGGASASSSAGGSASGSSDGTGSTTAKTDASTTVGSGDNPNKQKQQSKKGKPSQGKKFGKAMSSAMSSSSDGSKTVVSKKISVSDDDSDVTIEESGKGIDMKIVDRATGDERKISAKDAMDLKERFPEAFALYEKHMAGLTAAAGAGGDVGDLGGKLPPMPSAKEMLKKQIREMLDKPEVKGGPLEQALRDLEAKVDAEVE